MDNDAWRIQINQGRTETVWMKVNQIRPSEGFAKRNRGNWHQSRIGANLIEMRLGK
jgi:hypothetical protein